ncbi:MAG: VOC family protein [Polyangiaceae bacterium]
MSNATTTSGRFIWHELITPEPKATVGFYGELLGWTSSEVDMGPMGKYTLFKSNGVDCAGAIAPPPGKNIPPSWLGYTTTPDVDAAAKKAASLGGKIMMEPSDIPGIGRFAVFVDAQGAALAPFKPKEERAEQERPAIGTFCWDELLTSDPKAALAFYEGVFGYTHEDKDMGPMGTYHVLKRGERQAAGIMKHPMASAPTHWLHYVLVGDVDERTKRAAQLKGSVVVEPQDIPGIGRFSVVKDAQGAAFALFKGSM